jgi:hypothetical protein
VSTQREPRLREALRAVLPTFLAVRLGTLILGLLSAGLFPPLEAVSVRGWPAPPPPSPGWHALFTVWERFDALWFLRIATRGYAPGDGSAAFFPLYPMSVRLVSTALGGHPFAAALLVSNVAFLLALATVYDLTRSERSETVARTTVLLIATFPTALFFLAPYSEPLFLLLAATALRGARRGRWATAGVAGLGAALTRSVGIVLAAALAAEAIQRRRHGERCLVRGLLAAAATASGTLLYLATWQRWTGDALAPLHQQATWQRSFSWPWSTLLQATRIALRYLGQTNGPYWLIDWLLVVPVLAVSVLALVRYRWAFSVYLWGGLLVPLCFVFPDRPLMSMPRFVLPLFPAFWAAAEVLERRRVPRWAAAAVGAAGLGLLLPLFVNWYYVF